MSTLLEEQTLSLKQAAQIWPGRSAGKSLAFTTLWRWVLKGCRTIDGRTVRLEAIRLGARWVTSREAMQRFSDALTPGLADEAAPLPIRSPAARNRAAEQAGIALAEKGI